jgi:prepilin-type processing-associated H-X9-DG protein
MDKTGRLDARDKDPKKNLGVLFAGDIANVVFTDGHVDGIAIKEIDPAVFKALLTRNGDEKVPQ